MGWGRTLLLGDIGNRLDIGDVEQDMAQLKRKVYAARDTNLSQDAHIARLAEENAQLKLYLASLIRLLAAKGAVDMAELEAMVNAVDAEDGQVDGGYTGPIA